MASAATMAGQTGAGLLADLDACYFLTGETGRGKSFAAAAWLRAWAEREAEWHQDVYTDSDVPVAKGNPYWRADILWVTVPWFLGELRDAIAAQREPAVSVGRAARTWAVVLDDLGSEKATDWTAEQVFSVVSEREGNQLPTVVTTNEALSDLAAWHPRLASRLGGFTRVHFGGADRRMKGGL